jgi:cell division septation protein DedD
MMWRKIFRRFLLAGLIMLIAAGCTKTDSDQPPSRRDDIPESGREDGSERREERSDSQQPPASSPRAPRGDVKRNEYTVQVGIFNRAEEADQLAFDLRAQRVNNFVQQVGNQWRVCVGKYYSEGRATRMANQLKSMGFSEAKVIAPGN